MEPLNIGDVLSSFELCADNNYQVFCITHPVPQISYTQLNLKFALEIAMEMILEQYNIPYKNSELDLYADIMLKSFVKLQQYSDKPTAISELLLDNIELNVKSELDSANYVLSNSDDISFLTDTGIIFHQLDFNLPGTAMNTLLVLRIFLLAHYAVILNKQIEIQTKYEKFNLIVDIDIKKIDDEKYVFSPKMIKLQEK